MIQLRWVAIDKQAYREMPPPLRRLSNEQAAMVAMLQDEHLYRPEDIAATGYKQGTQAFRSALRAYHRLGQRSGLYETFDNRDKVAGEAYAWSGRSWKRAVGNGMARIALVMEELEQKQRVEPEQLFFLHGAAILGQNMAPIRIRAVAAPVPAAAPDPPARSPWSRHGFCALALVVSGCVCCWRC